MSSGISEGLVNGGKLLVHIAENGHSSELDCDEVTPVELVMRLIESFSGIHLSDQVVLCSGMKMDPQQLLSAYKLPSDDQEVFVFNKARLQNSSLPPPPEQVDVLDVVEPPLPSSSHDPHPLDDASDPALKALPSYERQFRYHYHRGHAIYSCTLVRYENCERLLRELKVQERALEVARGNLDQFYRLINQNYADFMKRYAHQHRVHSDLLVNFGRDVVKLKSIKLHPALQTATQKCLLDFVKEENLQKSVENCSGSHKQFENKVSQLRQMFGEVKRTVEDLFSSKASLTIRNLEQMIKEHRRYISEQKSIMQSLSKDVNTVKKLVDDCLSCQLTSSIRPHDAVSALGPMYDVHDKNHLPRMQACDHAISKLLDFCMDKKNEMNMLMHGYMQKVTYLTYVIKDVKLQFPVFKEAMARQDGLFLDLKLLRGIGPAYRASLAEVVRRKASMKLYMGMAGQLAERLSTKREFEVRRREEFLKAHGSYIPKDVLSSMGLFDTPNQCDVNIAPFDTGLLDIDISDLEQYAPHHLVGLLPNLDNQGSFKGSYSLSNDSAQPIEDEDIAADGLHKYISEEDLDSIDLVEISGTSKMEVENAKLKADLASAIALICSLHPEVEYEALDYNRLQNLLKNTAEKTAEALRLKDEYVKHLQTVLRMKQMQCVSYEKRIQDLEQRLSDQYIQGQKFANNKGKANFPLLADQSDSCKPDILHGETHTPCISTSEPMDEVSCISNSSNTKLGLLNGYMSKAREGMDENMMDSSGIQNDQLYSCIIEPHHEEEQIGDKEAAEKAVGQLGMSLTNSSTAESMPAPLNSLPGDSVLPGPNSKIEGDIVLELQQALSEKSKYLGETEANLKAAMEEVSLLRRELETCRKLLEESQMNCAHLENCLHEAREEAQTHLCAADRRASEYGALRASAVKMRSLFERLRSCVYSPGGVAGFSDSLHILAQSLSKMNDNGDDGTAEFQKCIRVLADRVGFLSRHREELLNKLPKIEAASEQLRNELEGKKELVKTLYTKHQLEKQANKEKISFGHLEVHEIAAFVLNAAGHYEAITRSCTNYYLSNESVELFTDHLPNQPVYIVGQIVHIERQIVKPLPPPPPPPPPSNWHEHGGADQIDQLTSDVGAGRLTLNSGSTSNPYGLPVGCEFFVVTIAMLPDTTTIRSPTTS